MALIESSAKLSPASQSFFQRRSLFAAAVAAALAMAGAYAYQGFQNTGLTSAAIHTPPIAGVAMDAIHMPGMQMSEMAGPVAGRPQSVLTPISCQKLPDVPGKTMTTMLVEYPPNGFTPRHRHPGNVTAIVLKGTIRSHSPADPQLTIRRDRAGSSRRVQSTCSPKM